MGSLLGGNGAAGQSDLMNQMSSAQSAMYQQQAAMMQQQSLAAYGSQQQAAMMQQSLAATSTDWPPHIMRELRRYYLDLATEWRKRGEEPLLPPRKTNIDKLRDEVRAWTRRAA